MRRIMPGAGVSIKGGKIEKVSGSLAKSQKNFSYRTEGALTLTLLGWMKNVEYLNDTVFITPSPKQLTF